MFYAHNLFFALRPEPEAAERIWRLSRDVRELYEIDGSDMTPERLHLTLAPFRPGMEPAAAMVRPPFRLTVNRLETWPNRRGTHPLVLWGDEGTIGAKALARALGRRTEPHVTILWSPGLLDDEPVEPITWTAREFVLIDSHVGESRHEVLGRWPLAG